MSFFEKLKSGMQKTRSRIDGIFNSFTRVDEDLLEELEETLILCDMGVATTEKVITALRSAIKQKGIKTADEVKKELVSIIEDMVSFDADEEKFPKIILVVGVNGVGKTTSIGKIANKYKKEGRTVLLAAADTFRAAAADQLTIWAKRADVPIIKYGEGHDPAAVVYDALDSAKHKGTDVVICDTAGRLHNKKNLMNELSKISRVIDKEYPEAAREILLVLDGTTGQNAISQAKEFMTAAGIDGIILTKLDGTAKGGVVVAIKDALALPVRYIGVGEGIDDLQPFEPAEFAKALVEG